MPVNLNLIFGYKVINSRKCGFPDNALNKVLEKLDDYKISYHINYNNDKPVIRDYKKLNNYELFFKKSLLLIDKQNKIDIAIEKINNATDKEIEEILEKILNVSDK